jgi:Zn-dependent M28 family amino/carboxypeptidase
LSLFVVLLALVQDLDKSALTIKADEIKKHQVYLSSDELEGREAGSEGGHKAALYLAIQASKRGLKPGGVDGTFFHPFGPSPGKPLEKGMKNVVAVFAGSDPKLKDEFVVVGAHYDHVGLGIRNSNRQAGGKPGEIHNGADDNASGSSTLLEVAGAAAKAKLKRTVVVIWFDAEESALAGSKAWVASPTLPIEKCVAMVNCDMIGRNDVKQVTVGVHKDEQGTPKFPKWADAVKEVETAFGASFDWTGFDSYIKRSDHWPFMEKGIPAVFFTGGLHADYHTQNDDVEKINFPKEERVGRMIFTLAARAANRDGTFQ